MGRFLMAAAIVCMSAVATVQATVTTYASMVIGQSPATHFTGMGILYGGLSSGQFGSRTGSPFVPNITGGVTEIGGWFYHSNFTIPNGLLEIYDQGANGLPNHVLGSYSVNAQLWNANGPLPTAAPPTVVADGSLILQAGQTYFLMYSATSAQFGSVEWFIPRTVPDGGVMPVDYLFGTPGAGGVITWQVFHPPAGTTDPIWNPYGFWVNVVPAPSLVASVAFFGLFYARRKR